MKLTKSRIYDEIGTVPRIALAKLAIETFEEKQRPLRVAIDISIWKFQALLAQGGSNPALRLLYYRLLRLLSLSIQAVFVFDGPKRPLLKRGVTRGAGSGYGNDERRTKKLIKLLGFEVHQAPGEAEAECALLQKRGLVDAVWSEDVDTLMFGATVTFKGWASEGAGSGPPTHVSIYKAKDTKKSSGLDPDGMILVALMSGGDYDMDGIQDCGSKRACEAARAGFGKKLCALDADDEEGLREWREDLAHELSTNESKFFSRKSKTIIIPDDFPRKEIFRYYTHPAVSSDADVIRLKDKLEWDRSVDIAGLREYVAEMFGWTGRRGAKKMIRGLAPSMLVYQLRERYNRRRSSHCDLTLTAANEHDFVRDITSEREHFSTDGTLELRVTYQPSTIVPWVLDAESDDGDEFGDADDDDNSEEARSIPESPSKNRSPTRKNLTTYDPTQLERTWILRSIVKVGVPLKVELYEEKKMAKEMGIASPKKTKVKTAPKKVAKAKGGMKPGALDRFLKVSKPMQPVSQKARSSSPIPEPSKADRRCQPPIWLTPLLDEQFELQRKESSKAIIRGRTPTPPYQELPRLQKKIEREGFVVEEKPASPNVRPRREYRKVSAPARTNQTTLSAFKITKSSKQQNLSQKGDSSPLRRHNTSLSIYTSDDEDPFYTSNESLSKKHPRNPIPPSPAQRSSFTTQHASSSPGLVPAKKRALLSCSKTVMPDSSGDEELPELKPVFGPRRGKGLARKSISPPTAMMSSPSVFEPKEKREIIDLLTSPIAPPRFSSGPVEKKTDRESPRRESLPQLTDDDSYRTARESGASSSFSYIFSDTEDQPSFPEPKQKQSRTSNPFSFAATTAKQKRFMAPRESLPGAWKEYTEEEMEREEKRGKGGRRFLRMSRVEVLDLTGGTP